MLSPRRCTFSPTGDVRVWDCFLVNDELELLRFRLDYLADVVDAVVIVEAPWTYTGQPKPLHVAATLPELRHHRHRIKHVVADESFGELTSPGDRERAQHRWLRHCLRDVGPTDLVIVGDVDEIASPTVLAQLRVDLREPARLIMDHAVLAANLKMPVPWTDGPMACRGNQLDHPDMGVVLGDPSAVWSPLNRRIVRDAGWHLSYLGGHQAVRSKLGSFMHTEFDTPFNRSAIHLDRCLRYGVDMRGRHLLKRLGADELPPLLSGLYAGWPQVFDFRPDQPLPARLLYRAYTRAHQWQGFPERLARAVERSRWRLVLMSPVLIACDLLASLALRSRERWRNRRRTIGRPRRSGPGPQSGRHIRASFERPTRPSRRSRSRDSAGQ